MILIIIGALLFIPGLIFFILGLKDTFRYYDSNEASTIVGAAVGATGLILLAVTGICALINNNHVTVNSKRVELQEKINSLENTRKALEYKIDSSTVTILEVNTYNENVRDFKTELTTHQLVLKNPWINLFACPAYNEFSPDSVSYLYIE